MKLKKFLIAIVLCLCSTIFLVGCNTSDLTAGDINLAVNQITRTNEEKFYDKIAAFYTADFSNVEVNIESYDESYSGIKGVSTIEKHIKYTDGKKIKYRSTIYGTNGELTDNLYEVADYSQNVEGEFLQYNLKTKTYKEINYELTFNAAGLTSPSHLLYALEEEVLYTFDNISINILDDGKEEFCFLSKNTSSGLYNYAKIVFDGNKLISVDIKNCQTTNIYRVNLTINYTSQDFVVDISECVPA